MSRDSVPKNSISIANRVFKLLRVKTWDDYVITPSEVVCSARFILLIDRTSNFGSIVIQLILDDSLDYFTVLLLQTRWLAIVP